MMPSLTFLQSRRRQATLIRLADYCSARAAATSQPSPSARMTLQTFAYPADNFGGTPTGAPEQLKSRLRTGQTRREPGTQSHGSLLRVGTAGPPEPFGALRPAA
jgi:hypothetical protein